MGIEERLRRVEAILRASGLDYEYPKVDEPANEPPKKWRILETGEVVCSSDWVNALCNKPDEDPPGGGWIPARASLIGREASQAVGLYVARPVSEEPAKEPEPYHPAGPKPDPGEGYRILSKDPPEDLRDGDEFFHSTLGRWRESIHAGWGYKRQDTDCWYRRKIEAPKDEYREPVLPADAGEQCEFSRDGKEWCKFLLAGWQVDNNPWICERYHCWPYARIKKDG